MADARDILTLAVAKRVLRISSADDSEDDLLAAYITGLSRTLDQYAGHTVAYTVTGELHDGINRAGTGWRHKIILRHRPVISIASVVEHRNSDPITITAETVTQQPGDSYLAERYDPDPALLSGVVRRRTTGEDAWWQYGRQNIQVTYTAGRVASTTMVDERFQHAARIMLENLWRDREPGLEPQGEFDAPRQSFPTFAVPNAVKQMLSDEIGQNKTWGAV